jgi:mRNA-decapping enzyme subunit 2
MHGQIPHHFMPPPHHQNNAMFQSPPQMPHMPHQQVPPPFPHSHDNQGMQQPQSFQAPQSQSFGAQGPAIPPASKLPAPKLNAHTLGLLNSFKVSDRQSPAPESSQATTHAQSPQMAPQQQHHAPRHHPNELASPHFQSPPINIQPAQPKPRSAHTDSLLTLFRTAPPTTSPEPAEPAELSAHPTTPGHVSAQLAHKSGRPPNLSLLDMFGNQPKPPGITSATVRGPVNAPDFEQMKKHTIPTSNSSRGASPFVPQQILRREQSKSRSPSNFNIGGGMPLNSTEVSDAAPAAFKPQILKRPQKGESLGPAPVPTAHAKGLLDMFKGPSPQPAAVQPAIPLTQSPAPSATAPQSDQKNTLLALFGKPSPKPEEPRVHIPLQQTHSPIPARRSPLPPTPKTTMSGVISPVSPFPEKGSQTVSPADFVSRSRISSIGDSVAPSIVIPPTSHPASVGQGIENLPGRGSAGGLSASGKSTTDGKSPVDKTFLLGFLEDVARRGR